ncbi:MAG: hypothetical protein A2Y28_05180 [Chlamydiae bacterium GWC2_50_10]|nr:MAG: hypothetical protein A2Z85_02355 [Chlamydiae bacterium GWA2_50_15]OGN54350.1 MAG: hypothetical protein A2Y28_05180 [Chlamydiae bacterium GWC2_50_10]OGN59019.1 MAG: hypothetical protein A3D18_02455 [Chlamydiae bacterium RIFCSPHIGHO2_02_FULL_49_29]OGN62838.1 MAG: hypothetical protein A3E26_03405 [Chlamydiae bacterium RIFCSPHIGHO2_12_FULL_49_32]OGN75227.1 MAG: hypothetical protein A3G30_05325 [Chlamydiae bacterium RIFCSPLOWO2_12_FULL_49_12]
MGKVRIVTRSLSKDKEQFIPPTAKTRPVRAMSKMGESGSPQILLPGLKRHFKIDAILTLKFLTVLR